MSAFSGSSAKTTTALALVVLVLAGAAALAAHDRDAAPAPQATKGATPDQRHLIVAVEESGDGVGLYDSKTGNELAHLRVGKWPHEIAVSADSTTAYVSLFGVKDYDEHIGEPGAAISVIDLKNMAEVRRLYTWKEPGDYAKYRGPHGIRLSPDGKRLFVNVEAPTDHLLVYDLTDPDVKFPARVFAIPKRTHNFLFAKDGKALWLVSGANGITRMDSETGQLGAQFNPEGTVFRGLTFSADGRQLVASANGKILFLDPDTFKAGKPLEDDKTTQFLNSAVHGKYILAPAVWEGQVVVFDTETRKVVRRIVVGADPVHVVVAPGGRSAYVSSGRSKWISEIDLTKLEEIRRIPTRGGPNGIAVVPFFPEPERKTLRFGAALPLTGGDAPAGADLRLGYQFWEELTNSAGGLVIGGAAYRVEIVYRDTQSSEDAAFLQGLVADLIHKERVNFLLGGYPSKAHFTLAAAADRLQVPLVTSGGAAEAIYKQGHRYVFGIQSPARGFLNGSVEMALQRDPKLATIAFVSCLDPAAVEDAKTTAAFAQQKGLRVVDLSRTKLPVEKPGVLVFPHDRPVPLEPYVEELKALQPDLVAVTGHVGESIAFVKAAHRLGLTPKAFLFSVGPAVPKFAADLGAAAEHMMGSAMWSPSQIGFGHDRFITPAAYRDAFFQRFAKEPSHLAAGGTASLVVYEEAFRKAGSIDPVAVRNALAGVDVETFYSRIRFDHRGLNKDRQLITVQLRNVGKEMRQIPLWPPQAAGDNQPEWPFRWPSVQPAPVREAVHPGGRSGAGK